MDVFSIDLTHNEIAFVRQSLDSVTISGKDAKFLSSLQTKIETELSEIAIMKREEEARKLREIQEIQMQELEKQNTKKKG
jgi:hypothetical protein